MKKKIIILTLLLLLIAAPLVFLKLTVYETPSVEQSNVNLPQVEADKAGNLTLGENWIRQNPAGNWESYIEGEAFERGLAIGRLHRELIIKQEEIFVKELKKKLPNKIFRKLMLYGVSWFNRNLDQTIPLEFRKEIYGVSRSFSDDFNFIGPKFNRIINYHAAHDIGHMAQNMNLVACSAVARWDFEDGRNTMLLGRNFDFYFGDDFAKNKIVLLINPDKGYKFLSVTWGGFCGVVSGMNEKGLTVTLNALPSEIPSSAATPVSVIAREVLQYASTIQEAYDIVSKHDVFVSESFTIASAIDKRAAVIEKTPETTDLYFSSGKDLIVTNHFQGEKMANSELNKEHLAESESSYRYERLEELIGQEDSIYPAAVLSYLRDRQGVNDCALGNGNPMAINQLLAHHAVIFDPINLIAYVSNAPFQEGVFSAYNVKNIGSDMEVRVDSLQLPFDSFIQSENFSHFLEYKKKQIEILSLTEQNPDSTLSLGYIQAFIQTNPDYYETYKIVGDHFYAGGNQQEAKRYYKRALEKKIPYSSYRLEIEERMKGE